MSSFRRFNKSERAWRSNYSARSAVLSTFRLWPKDVWEKESADLTDPIFALNNLIVSAHNAGTSIEGKNKVVRAALQSVVSYSRGELLRDLLHLEAKK